MRGLLIFQTVSETYRLSSLFVAIDVHHPLCVCPLNTNTYDISSCSLSAQPCRYSSYYLTRNSLNYVSPVMVADPKLALDITQVGAMTSIFPIAYGMSKFVSGVLGARMSPTVLLAGGLMATAAINVAFGFGTSLAWFCFFWALNGTLQVRSGCLLHADAAM